MNLKEISPRFRSTILVVFLILIIILIFSVGYSLLHTGHSISPPKKVVAVATCSGENITVTYTGGPEAGLLVNITVYDSDPANFRVMGGKDGILPVGSSLELIGPFFSPAHIIAVAHYNDGTSDYIVDMSLKCGSGPVRTYTPVPSQPNPNRK
ncbi:MAG: hypothetical protein WC379_15860 [Methanoregula sp.]|jgi:hypothetical protein